MLSSVKLEHVFEEIKVWKVSYNFLGAPKFANLHVFLATFSKIKTKFQNFAVCRSEFASHTCFI